MEKIFKVFNSIIKGIDEKERTLTALISTNVKDRMGDILEPKGAEFRHYRKNPVVLWAHDYLSLPIGKSLWEKRSPEGIISKVKFADTDFANDVFNLYREGFLNAFSVGFIPKESEPIDKDKDEGYWGGKRFTKWELLEYSAVPVPANPEALTLAVQKGIITEERKVALDEMLERKDNEPEPTPDEELDNKETPKGLGLEEITAELELIQKEVKDLKEENAELRYKIYTLLQHIEKSKKKEPEITVDTLSEKFGEVLDGVIRQATGKV